MARSAVLSWLQCFLIVGALVAWIPSLAATAEKRVALVVGNAAYAGPGESLPSPCNDAQAIAGVLRDQLGFEVIEACNLNRLDLNSRIEEFVARIQPGGVALFFYAGHGVDVGGQNYLLPVGHAGRSQSDVEVVGYPLRRAIEAMESRGSQLNVVLLDACRENPLPGGTRGATKGLARVEAEKPGTIIGFATRPGETTEDGQGSHSPFTQALLASLALPGLSVPEMLNEVGLRTAAATGQRQNPWWSQSAVPSIHLAGTGSTTTAGPSSAIVGALRIMTTPSGAKVYVSGSYVGVSPIDVDELPPGMANVEAKLPGYVDASENALVQGARRVELMLYLSKPAERSSLYVDVDPVDAGARILVNGQPYRIGMTLAGSAEHQVEVSAPGYEKQTVRIRVVREEERLAIRLVKADQPADFEDLTGPMVDIAGGEFQMGNSEQREPDTEKPVHTVGIKPFRLGKYEVTVSQFRRFAEETGYLTEAERGVTVGRLLKLTGCVVPDLESILSIDFQNDNSWRNPGFAQSGDHPVVCVSWNDAVAYTNWISSKTGRIFRLPSEAQWEYAARAGRRGNYFWGPNVDDACIFANGADATTGPNGKGFTDGLGCADKFFFTAPVGTYRPNRFGLHDMSGNVLEWVADCWHANYSNAPSDGSPWLDASGGCEDEGVVVRGGSWASGANDLRLPFRVAMLPAFRECGIGFRMAEVFPGD